MLMVNWLLPMVIAAGLCADQGAIDREEKTRLIQFTPNSTAAENSNDSLLNTRQTYSKSGFGDITKASGYGIGYKGNVGKPYGSNIIKISAENSASYQYVAEFKANTSEAWTVVIWNKIGPDGRRDGWYGNACERFTLEDGKTQHIAFDENSQGGWAAAPGYTIPVDDYGGYASTWGEFDFGSTINSGWSGFDVSAIAAQASNKQVHGMSICDSATGTCSSISSNGRNANNAYTFDVRKVDGIGVILPAGPVYLAVMLEYED